MINFKCDFKEKSREIYLDKSQISRVFQNLIINSIQSIQEKINTNGSICIESSYINNSLIITIIDNGTGIKFKKDELVKPYFTTKKRKGGSGLGLAIVEKILFDHNADFSIDKRDDQIEGTKVEVKFDLNT